MRRSLCVGVGDWAVGIGGAAHEHEPQRLRQAVQQHHPVAERDGMDGESVLVDQALARERSRQAGAPNTTMSLPAWRLNSGICSATGRSETRALFHSTVASVLENTTLGSAFMCSAIGLCVAGHARTMPS